MQAEIIALKKSVELDVCNAAYQIYIELFNKENIEYEPIKGKITKNKVIKWFESIDNIDHPWISEHTCDYMFDDVFSYLGFGKYIKVKYETVTEVDDFDFHDSFNDLTYIFFINPNGNVNPNNKYIYTTEVSGAFCIYMKDLIEMSTNAILNYLIKV
jgi:hypothetical protein